MNFRRVFISCLLLSSIGVAPNGLSADECICCKTPMYPYSGTLWLHYAVKYKDGCIYDYPVPQIQIYTPTTETCNAMNCGSCSSLGNLSTMAEIVAGDLQFMNLRDYDDIDESDEILTFLKTGAGASDIARLNTMEFSHPEGHLTAPVVELHRRDASGGSKPFYAVLWKMKITSQAESSHFGVEISDPGSADIWTPAIDGTFRAIVSAKAKGTDTADDLKQAIQLKSLLEVKINGNTYFVRLHDSPANRHKDAFPSRLIRKP